MRIYLDTSVISGLYTRDPGIHAITHDFFSAAKFGNYTLYSSEIAAIEIKATSNIKLRQMLIEALEEHQIEILPISEEAEALARRYTKEKIIPAKYIADALHIAMASIHGIPILASWNFKHIVKHKTRVEVNRINQESGLLQIDICSPQEV